MTPDNTNDTDTTNETEPSMTAPIFEPDTTTKPAKPRRNRLWAVAAVLLAVALAGGAALYAATRSSGDAPAAAPADPSPAAGSDPAPAPTPSDTPTPTAAAPTPATPEEAARAELLALPTKVAAAADKAFVDQTGDPNTYFDPVTGGAFYQYWIRRVNSDRSDGTVYQQRTTTIHSSEVTALDLSGGTATVQSCQSLIASGINGDGSPGSVDEPRSLMTYPAERGPDGGWRLIGRTPSGLNTC